MHIINGLIFLHLASDYIFGVFGRRTHACHNKLFNPGLCDTGTQITITRIEVVASHSGNFMCRTSRANCSKYWPETHRFTSQARAACDGRMSCDNLIADVNKFKCPGLINKVKVSYIQLEYECITATTTSRTTTSGPTRSTSIISASSTTTAISTTNTTTITTTTTTSTAVPTVGARHSSVSSSGTQPTAPDTQLSVPAPSDQTSPTAVSRVSTAVTPNGATSASTVDIDSGTIWTDGPPPGVSTETAGDEVRLHSRGDNPVVAVAVAVPLVVVFVVGTIVLVVCLVSRRKQLKPSDVSEQSSSEPSGSSECHNGGTNVRDMPDLNPSDTMYELASFNTGDVIQEGNKNSHRMTMDVSDVPYPYDTAIGVHSQSEYAACREAGSHEYSDVQGNGWRESALYSEPTGPVGLASIETRNYTNTVYNEGIDIKEVNGDVTIPESESPKDIYAEVRKPKRVPLSNCDHAVQNEANKAPQANGPSDVYSEVRKPKRKQQEQTYSGEPRENGNIVGDMYSEVQNPKFASTVDGDVDETVIVDNTLYGRLG